MRYFYIMYPLFYHQPLELTVLSLEVLSTNIPFNIILSIFDSDVVAVFIISNTQIYMVHLLYVFVTVVAADITSTIILEPNITL